MVWNTSLTKVCVPALTHHGGRIRPKRKYLGRVDPETGEIIKYMKVYEREWMIERRGETRGETKGEMKGEVKIVRNMSKSMKQDQISVPLGQEPEYIEEILTYIQSYLKETDKEIDVRILAAMKKEK